MSRAIVVIPCYNESRRLNTRKLVEFIERYTAIDLLLVNDGSSDATAEILEHLRKAYPERCTILHLAANSGKAEAVRQGICLALEAAPRYVGFWDADLATPLDELAGFKRVLDRRAELDLVLGTRMSLLGHAIERRPLRRLLGAGFSRVAALALATPLRDSQCGAKLFRVTPQLVSAIATPYLSRWIFEVELFARLQALYRCSGGHWAKHVYEYPLESWTEMAGSKLRMFDMPRALVELACIWWKYRGTPSVQMPASAAQPRASETAGQIAADSYSGRVRSAA